jgi:hypothetical protein
MIVAYQTHDCSCRKEYRRAMSTQVEDINKCYPKTFKTMFKHMFYHVVWVTAMSFGLTTCKWTPIIRDNYHRYDCSNTCFIMCLKSPPCRLGWQRASEHQSNVTIITVMIVQTHVSSCCLSHRHVVWVDNVQVNTNQNVTVITVMIVQTHVLPCCLSHRRVGKKKALFG